MNISKVIELIELSICVVKQRTFTLKSMSKGGAVAPMVDLKIQRHCAFDTFVSRVDQRVKHSSGLAIHQSAKPVPDPRKAEPYVPPKVPKTKYYKEVERQYRERQNEDPIAIRNREAKKMVAKELEQRLRIYQAAGRRGLYHYTPCEELDQVDVAPDTEAMAMFRFRLAVGPMPWDSFDE